MLSSIIAWAVGGGITAITGQILKWQEQKNNAKTEQDRIAAEVEIKRLEKLLEVNKGANEIRMQTAGFWEMRIITFAIAFFFTTHVGAVWLDTMFKFGWKVNAFPAPMNDWEGLIVLSFFGVQLLAKPLNNLTAGFAQWMKK